LSQSLIERSRRALLARFAGQVPDLEEILGQPPGSTLITGDDGRGLDIDLDGTRLYRGDGLALADQQVTEYLRQPLRFFLTDLLAANGDTGMGRRLSAFLGQRCRDHGLTPDQLTLKPDYDGSYLVVFGIGLGYHLERLIRETRVRHVFLAEPVAEFLRQSLATVDWEQLLGAAEARGTRFSLSLEDRPDHLCEAIEDALSAEGAPFIDGTFVFSHYPLRILQEARDRLARQSQIKFLSRGSYEDERVMMTNASRNLARHSCHLLDARPKPERSQPVLIIGSGPSIDRDLEHIKRWRAHALVFSCGSALRLCLLNGIVPDFHCEIENGPAVYQLLEQTLAEQTQARQILAGVTLVASTTVDPRLPPLFGQSYLFFRDAVSPTRVLATPEQIVPWASPTVANTALATAAALGFTRIYFFGVDCGSRQPQHKHARDTLYHVDQQLKLGEQKLTFDYPLPGNFGGTVLSNWVFTYSLHLLGNFLQTYRVQAWNCSDGARIPGAPPQLAAGLRFPGPPLDRASLKQELAAQLTLYPPGAYLQRFAAVDFAGEVRRYYRDLLALIDRAAAEDGDFVAFWSRLSAFLREAGNDYAGVGSVSEGTSRSLLRVGMFFIHRVPDRQLRAILFQDFLAEYRRLHQEMQDGTLALFAELSQRLEHAD